MLQQNGCSAMEIHCALHLKQKLQAKINQSFDFAVIPFIQSACGGKIIRLLAKHNM
jgi:hypothetical protein